MKEKIAKWYKLGLWDAEKVQAAVDKGILTAEEYAEILTGAVKTNETEGS